MQTYDQSTSLRSNLGWLILTFIIAFAVPFLAFAQGEPTDWIETIQQLLQKPEWFIGASIATWAVLQLIMGKEGFAIPGLSDWLNEKLDKRWKAIIILVLSAAAGGLASAGSGDAATIITSALTGLSAGIAASGVKSLGKAVIKNPE